MSKDTKPEVQMEETFDKLEIRLGKIIAAEPAPGTAKPAYVMRIDFGKFGVRTSVGRFTKHAPEEMLGALVMGVLNFPPRQVGDTVSEALTLGVQYPGADSGEATFISPKATAKIGSKLF